MAEMLDGLGEGMKEWRNVQFIVRKAFNTIFHELRDVRAQMARQDALVARMSMAETKLARLAKTLEERETKDSQTKVLYDLMKRSADKQQPLSSTAGRGAAELYPSSFDVTAAATPAAGLFEGASSRALVAKAVSSAFPTVKFTCEGVSLRTTKGNIEWTDRSVVGGDCGCFEWKPSAAHYIRTALEGVYEVNVGVFSPSTPRVTLTVDGDEVLVSRTCRSYVTTKTMLSGRGGCHTIRGCTGGIHNPGKCGKQCVTGQTIHDLIWLPAGAKLAVHLEADTTYATPRVKDALCILRFVQ